MIPTFFRPHLLALFISVALLWVNPSFAGSATWNLNPVDGNWNNASNWTPNTIPNGTNDVATFGISNKTAINVGINDPTETVSEIVFNPGASPYTITVPHVLDTVLYFAITGAGISNNSGTIQNLGAADYFATIFFTGEASAGSDTAILAGGRATGTLPGQVEFLDDATAGSATVTANHGVIMFNNHSTAANATLIAEAGPTNVGGEIEFRENSMGD
ncbi:MAG: hypothetical protein H0X40_08700 [Chthoniobacterales bacterium]|nr:hypothetical protein [Chthoniobacterales bacterium]